MTTLADGAYYTNGRGQLVHVMRDTGCESPRDDDHLMGTFYVWSRDHASPDAGLPADAAELGRRFGLSVADSPRAFCEEFSRRLGVALPVWACSHGTVTYRAAPDNPFADPWDSALAGLIFATDERIRELRCVDAVTAEVRKAALRELVDEVDEYSSWAAGEAYRYVAYDARGIEVDRGWGFIGDDGERNGLDDEAGPLCEAGVGSVDEWVANGGRTYGVGAEASLAPRKATGGARTARREQAQLSLAV